MPDRVVEPSHRAELRRLLDRHLVRVRDHAGGDVVLLSDDPWFGDLPVAGAPDDAAHNAAHDAALVIDALRRFTAPQTRLTPTGRMIFVERVNGDDVDHFDVSGYLWSCGLSSVDIDRPQLPTARGHIEYAIGTVRHTPPLQTD